MTGRDPVTREEWVEAVTAALVMVEVHAAMAYGLITGPEVNVDRCEEILERSFGELPEADWPTRGDLALARRAFARGEAERAEPPVRRHGDTGGALADV